MSRCAAIKSNRRKRKQIRQTVRNMPPGRWMVAFIAAQHGSILNRQSIAQYQQARIASGAVKIIQYQGPAASIGCHVAITLKGQHRPSRVWIQPINPRPNALTLRNDLLAIQGRAVARFSQFLGGKRDFRTIACSCCIAGVCPNIIGGMVL